MPAKLVNFAIESRIFPGEAKPLSERVYRDPVHNIIRADLRSAEGRLIAALIDTPEFQRLRRVRQLGLAHFAYQGAEHTRFQHSLGAFHIAGRALGKLAATYDIPAEQQTAVRVAALLHDVGHGPFSHVMEPILGFRHEAFTIEAVLSHETEIGRLIAGFSPDLAADVAAIIGGTFEPTALGQLVSSQLDVDRMDYLLRDSMMTGVKYGVYDIEWVLRSLEIDTAEDRLYISAPGIYAVEDYLQARYYMYRQVYFHRTLRAAEAVLQALVRRALVLVASGTGVAVAAAPMEKVLRGEKLVLAEHLELDDTDIIFSIKQWRSSGDPVLADLAKRFVDRRLFKAFDLDMPENERSPFLERARTEVADAGFDPDYYFIEDTGGDAPHYFYSPASAGGKDRIYVEDGFARPVIREISEVSAAVRGLQKAYRIHRVCFPPELSRQIGKLYHGLVGRGA